jgi:hypothetical protein
LLLLLLVTGLLLGVDGAMGAGHVLGGCSHMNPTPTRADRCPEEGNSTADTAASIVTLDYNNDRIQ